MSVSETIEKIEVEKRIPNKTGIIKSKNRIKWSEYKFPVTTNKERVITIPKVKTALSDGLNSSPFVPLYSIATGGPPIAAIIPKTPESVPAVNEFIGFLFTFHPK